MKNKISQQQLAQYLVIILFISWMIYLGLVRIFTHTTDIPLTEKLPNNVIIDIEFIGDIPPIFKENEYLYPNIYRYNDNFWKKYHSRIVRDFSVAVEENNTVNYYLKVTKSRDKYYLYTLHDKDNKVIYQQRFMIVKNKVNKNILSPLPLKIPLEIRNIENRKYQQLLWQTEKGQEHCPIKKLASNPDEIIWLLDKKQIKFFVYDQYQDKVSTRFIPSQAICSENYLLVVNYSKKFNLIEWGWLFERKTGLPVAEFWSYYNREEQLPITKKAIKQFELVVNKNKEDNSYLTLHTDEGDIRLRLRARQREI